MKLSRWNWNSYKSVVLSLAVVAAVAVASDVTLPHSFVAGTSARAAEVNANFAAVKAAVDDNHARLTTLETASPYTAASLLTDWTNVSGGWETAAFKKDALGFVHVRGLIRRASGSSSVTAFTLPAGFRPPLRLQFPVRCGNDTMCYVHVNSNGNVDCGIPATGDATSSLTLDGIVFDTR